MSIHTDTIAAIATAPGRGGVGIVRLSGPKSKAIGESIAQHTPIPRYAHYGSFIDPVSHQLIDQGICLFFPGPHSFTGEDVVELHGHGGPVILNELLNIVIQQGARLAKPGEFSERAFLNDKMDLTQAEAIADLIDASSKQAVHNAMNSLQGLFSSKIHELVEKLTHLRIYVEAAIDFPEEEIDFINDGKIEQELCELEEQLQNIFNQAQQGVLVREGMKVVIAGKPNAGKSSLLNALAGKEAAIVTDIAGTTRDVLKEHIHLDGMPLHIIDTAGLRNSSDIVEQIGIERAWQEIELADRLLLLIDSSNTASITKAIESFIAENATKNLKKSKISVICNKIDKNKQTPRTTTIHHIPVIYLSAKTGEGIHLLVDHLKSVMGYHNTTEGGFTARRRHIEALQKAQTSLLHGKQQLHHGAGELLAEDLRLSQQYLGEITGLVSADELLGKIFSSFCIGK
ncbi:tRNA uridine-5-carboxymethylaminomethyl(34) synthesis GTPase MnmE [Candidatus Endobugula sertula]|uniref:tRNA modification GTPase MnmE n=1 Tax=Candidatus Endobugula sertula TaxID=62101 RepID=A0A1D2QS25_9GAMM|nr:tRNA uridine-5-carboxymethylaminomethyl(34) synthesis GTPase MnmE [Candidatus Endobugula sertula]